MSLDKFKIEDKGILIGVGILIILFSLLLFGITGLRVVAGVFLLFLLPFYLILDNFELSLIEKILFAFFIGLGIFPSIAYGVALLVNSIRLAVVITFVLLIGIGFVIMYYKKKIFTN